MNPLLLLGGGALLAALLFSAKKAKAAPRTLDQVETKLASVAPSRRKAGSDRNPVVVFTPAKVFWRVNKKTGKTETRTQIQETPEALAAQASEKLGRRVPVATFSLAAMIQSEVGDGPDLAKVAVAHAGLTYARTRGHGKTLHQLLIGKDGHYGGQQGRYASTSHAPTERAIELAEAVLSEKIANPVPGAIQWDSPNTQNKLRARGEAGYTTNAAQLASVRENEGKRAAFLPGVEPGYLRLWVTAA